MKLSTFLCGAVFLAGAMLGVSSVNAAPDLQDAVEPQEEALCCWENLAIHVCYVTAGMCNCSNCGISDTDGVAAEEVDLTVKPLRLPFGI
ncbi:hypothetical protein [Nannocystis punicea]|uniref:Uncharacterized protein n=1 Tax=Nannocystis punicea TaxID=2995304 RepID=A0ABY7GS09_9BACT|nr:hypothetical protein [Nannocystis poenicansa]WAS89725.1 hypothetical protein O0S08_26330 [Nannocystis poenicansa]